MLTEEQKLDNPVWYSLSETHRDFAVHYEGIKFYDPSYCAFGGFVAVAKTLTGNDEYSKRIADFYIVGEKPYCSNRLKPSPGCRHSNTRRICLTWLTSSSRAILKKKQ